jgi:RNA polymerase sigma-70 factor (ECF subfamily)
LPENSISIYVEAIITLPPISTRSVMEPEPGTHDEASLVRRAVRGEVAAFEQLYRRTVGRVYAVCLRMCGNPQLAEELSQESYLRAWKKIRGFRGDSTFVTWMHRVAVNVVLGHLRSRQSRSDRSTTDLDSREIEPWVPPADTGARVDLERAIARLPERARVVFVLHDVEGYRHRDIAGLTGMAVGTSKAHLSRARRLLREALKNEL